MRILFTGAFIDLKETENNMRVRIEKNHAWINILPYFEFGASCNRLSRIWRKHSGSYKFPEHKYVYHEFID